jgi:predicted homoserine dehydrogenase-like protein
VLERLKRLKAPVRVGMTGAGAMGKGLLHQCRVTPGIECVVLADTDCARAVAAAQSLGVAYRVVESERAMNDAIRAGELAVTTDGFLAAECEAADVFVESSSAILPAAEYSIAALERGKHLVLMNAEIDLAFGPALLALAREEGVVYTSCDGDQHGVIRRIIDDVTLWGFEVVMAGNIKGFLDRYSNPVKIVPEADKRNLSYQMATAYTDGTKLNIEMALLANALGYRTLTPGMLGPRARDVHEVFGLFDFEAIRAGGVPAVDYILGSEPNGGVFVVAYCDHPYQRDMMSYYKMGDGPFYLFYRPYHLCHVEAMESIAAAALDGVSLLEPRHGMRTNVYAYAKKPLAAGETLDGIGGFACYGMIENDAAESDGLPICLAEGVELRRDVAPDARITMADVALPAQRRDFRLHGLAVRGDSAGELA